MRVGYTRVGSLGQSFEIQHQRLVEKGCEKVFKEKKSAKNDERTLFKAVLEYVREGDQVIVTKLDRLARYTFDLQRIVKTQENKKVDLIALDQQIDICTPAGSLLFTMIGAIAEFERDLITDRSAEGRKAANEKGAKFGAPQKLTKDEKEQLVNSGRMGGSKSNLAEIFGVGRTTAYRILEEAKAC